MSWLAGMLFGYAVAKRGDDGGWTALAIELLILGIPILLAAAGYAYHLHAQRQKKE